MTRFFAVLLCVLTVMPLASPAQEPPALMLAQRAPAAIDPAGYWVSEKLDGVRACWDGAVLRFRSGRLIAVPDWFVAALPARPLDGELWIGRGRFEQVSGVVRRETADDAAWRPVRYMLFDLPGDPDDFSRRVDRMVHIVDAAGVPWLQAVPQRRLADRAALKRTFDEVVAGGGEGLMLHRADAH